MFRFLSAQRVAVVCIVALTAACSRDPEVAKRQYVRNGDRFVAEKNYRAAIVEYRNAVRIDGQFGAARFKLAQAYDAAGNRQSARDQFVRAADLLSQDAAAQLAAATALLGAGEFRDARARAQRALELDSKNAMAYLVRGSAAAGLRDFDGALKSFEEGLIAEPRSAELRVNIGILKTLQGNASEAETAFKQAIAVDPGSVPARLALGNYYWWLGRETDAERAIRDAVVLDPNGMSSNRALALFYLATNRASDAELPLRRAADATEDPQPRLILADYYIGQKRYAEALPILQKLTGDPASFAAASIRRATIAYQTGETDQAYAILDEVIAKEPKNTEVLLVKGGWLLGEKKLATALETAQAAVKVDPESWSAHELLGSVHVARRQPEQAMQALTEALRLNGQALNTQILLSDLNLVQGKTAAAVRFADDAVRTRPDSGLARLALVRALVGADELKRARIEIQPLLLGSPDAAAVQIALGQLEAGERNDVAARRAFERAAALDPRSPEPVAGLLQLDVAAKQVAQAVKRVEDYVSKVPDDAEILYLAAVTYANAGSLAQAEASVKKVIALDASHMKAYNLLASLYIQQQKLDLARIEYERIIQQQPMNISAHTMTALLLQAQRKDADAKKMYEKILSLDRHAVVAANNLAYMYAEEDTNLDIALNLAQTAKAARPDDPDVNDTLAWVYYKRGLPSLAIEPLEHSIKVNPSNPFYHYHLGVAFLKLGDRIHARRALEQALSLQPNFERSAEARKALTELQR
jgi:tetratricopeptide (TPR) repeat protein